MKLLLVGVLFLSLAYVALSSPLKVKTDREREGSDGHQKIPGMPTDMQRKINRCVDKMNPEQKLTFWEKLKLWWNKFKKEVKKTVKQVGAFFTKLFNPNKKQDAEKDEEVKRRTPLEECEDILTSTTPQSMATGSHEVTTGMSSNPKPATGGESTVTSQDRTTIDRRIVEPITASQSVATMTTIKIEKSTTTIGMISSIGTTGNISPSLSPSPSAVSINGGSLVTTTSMPPMSADGSAQGPSTRIFLDNSSGRPSSTKQSPSITTTTTESVKPVNNGNNGGRGGDGGLVTTEPSDVNEVVPKWKTTKNPVVIHDS